MENDLVLQVDLLKQRIVLLESKYDFLTAQARSTPKAAPATVSGKPVPEISHWAEEWLDRWDTRGTPRSRVAAQHECRKPGGDGKGDWSGDPNVRKDPPKWKEYSNVGKSLSQCSVEFLLIYADFEEWKAGKDAANPEKNKWVIYGLRNAALAKGWARLVNETSRAPVGQLEALANITATIGTGAGATVPKEDDPDEWPF